MFKNNMVRYAIEALVIAAVIIAVILCVKFSNFKNNDGAGVGLTVDPDSGTFVDFMPVGENTFNEAFWSTRKTRLSPCRAFT